MIWLQCRVHCTFAKAAKVDMDVMQLCIEEARGCDGSGHNGAGKTTLMKEIAAHRIVGMPSDRP